MRRIIALLGLIVALQAAAAPARAQDHVSFGIDWVAEAEYGGYYQALATGLYAKRGLAVTIRQGGPQVNQMQLMMAGRLDFNLGGGRAIEFAQQNLPFVAIAAIFQKDPAVLIAHPGMGNDSFAALKGKPIMISGDTRAGWWRFLAAKFGYSDSQIRTYSFNLAPFLADKGGDPAGLSRVRTVLDQTGGGVRAGGAAGRRRGVCRLRQHRRHQQQADRRQARRGAAFHQRIDRGMVLLPQ